METVAYFLLAIVALAWLLGILIGAIEAFPFGILILVVIVALGLLFIKVLRDRIGNKEDDYYSKHIEK